MSETITPAKLIRHTPRFTFQEALTLVQENYGLQDCLAFKLPSERDQNFLIEAPEGERYVLKVSNSLETPAFLEAQQRVLERLAKVTNCCPQLVPTKSGAALVTLTATLGAMHFARLVTYLPGVPLGRVGHHSPELLRDLGRCLGTMDGALVNFDHPALHRDFHWDLANASRIIGEQMDKIADPTFRETVHRLAARCSELVQPLLTTLRKSAIHGDANDFNVLVDDGPDLAARHQRVTGIIDYGDMVHSYTVGNVAIAAAYALLDKPDPLAAAAYLIEGYHGQFPLTDAEIAALFGFIGLRLCVSACIAQVQQKQRPADAYLAVTQGPLARTLPRLLAIHPRLAEAVFRRACGRPPCPAADAVAHWLKRNASAARPLLDLDLRTTESIVFDLSIASPLNGENGPAYDEPALTARLFGAMKEAGVRVGVGRYNEPRLLYASPAFAGDAGPLDERRTIHLGLDLFVAAGSPLYAPLAGTVHAFANNAIHQDYGPVVILRHQTDEGQAFFTLYGHLGLDTLDLLRLGQPIAAGQRIGSIGAAEVNGGWPPHLHFQIITDLLDLATDFPGVAAPSQRDIWLSLSPDANLIAGIPAHYFPAPEPTFAGTLDTRRKRLGRNLSIAYRKPLKIVRGWMQHLFDDEGRRYLDAYNNVPHVGHCHPRVVQAAQRQMAVLNTNTRYLHDLINRYAQRIAATLPEPLSVCYFLNSASEANELALRLARTHTRHRDVIVLEAAYHGHTNALIDISPYKHAGPGGTGAPPWVQVVPIPDGYRGLYKQNNPQIAEKYAQHVRDAIARSQGDKAGLAAFIAETRPSVGGQITLPDGYLAAVYRDVRAAGGLCIADEVQTGLGRVGTHFWAFESHGVVPDIVVMGKPMGNGHPLAAVVTTPEIADSFNNGMEFFSTYGGNAVSCAVGLAVLDVLEQEGLQAQALEVGERMLEGLRASAQRHAIIGDVRGSGMFLGVELVRNRETLEPAAEEASLIVNRMAECHILLGTDGPYHNVIKIRPPMPFSREDGELLVATLDRVLGEEFGSYTPRGQI